MRVETKKIFGAGLIIATMSLTLNFGRAEGGSSGNKMRRRGLPPEVKAALKECSGGKKHDELSDVERAKVKECMEKKGFKRPAHQGGEDSGQSQRPDGPPPGEDDIPPPKDI